MVCSNVLCSYNYDGYCNNDEDEYYQCENQSGQGEEDYAFADYDCKYGLFGDE